jgi:hypothetical protein
MGGFGVIPFYAIYLLIKLIRRIFKWDIITAKERKIKTTKR